jgi:predicted alpha/beta-hydrolase family hydrolase
MTAKGDVTEWEWQGPKRGFDRAVLLAHGAGADMHSATLTRFADELAGAGIPSLRFNYPYRTAGRRSPDRAAVLESATRVAATELARRAELDPSRLVLGGRSMGGRYCSLVAADGDDPVPALGLLLLGYPLHAPGRSDAPRSDHFARLHMPVMFVSGDRDQLASWELLRRHARKVKGPVEIHRIPTGDHGFKPLKREGHTLEAVLDDAACAATEWVAAL